MPKRIGLLVDSEQAFAETLLSRCNRQPDIIAELVEIGGTAERHISRYEVLIDRASRRVPHYRAYLKACALAGVAVINDPFWHTADDGFFGLGYAARLGLATSRVVLLPQKDYGPEVDHQRGLRNLEFPLKWHELMDYVRLPAVLRRIHKGKYSDGAFVHNAEQLWAAFDGAGCDVMMLQEHIDAESLLRAVYVGPDNAFVVEFGSEPVAMRTADSLDPAMVQRVKADSIKLGRALGYDVFSIDFAVRDGVPYLIEAPDPLPDLSREHLTEAHFDTIVDAVAGLAVRYARNPTAAKARYLWRQSLD